MSYWAALVIAIIANIGANVAFKYFVADLDGQLSFAMIRPALASPWLWVGFLSGLILVAGFLYALQKIPLTIAYTSATCLSIVGVACAGVMLFGETLGLRSVAGIAIVLTGLTLLVGG